MNLFSLEIFLLLISTLVGIFAYLRYGFAVYQDRFSPNVISRLSWGLLASTGAYLQYVSGAGLAVVATGLMALGSFGLAYIAYIRNSRDINKIDVFLFIITLLLACFLFLPISTFAITVLMTITSIIAFGPTINSIFKKPSGESVEVFLLSGFKFLLAIPLIGTISINTALYPISLIAMNLLVCVLILMRKS